MSATEIEKLLTEISPNPEGIEYTDNIKTIEVKETIETIVKETKESAKNSKEQKEVKESIPKENVIKKKPGRPKKISVPSTDHYFGLCKEGEIKNTIMELHYTNPAPLKKAINLLKMMEVHDLRFIFTEEKWKIITTDHINKNDIITEINGSKMFRYYCKEPYQITIDPDNIKTLFNLIDKNCDKIIIYSNHTGKFSKLCLIIDCKSTLGTISRHTIDLINNSMIEEKDEFNISDYPLYLRIPSKTFKKYITNIYATSDELTFQKEKSNENNSLQISYTSRNKKIKSEVNLIDGIGGINIIYTDVNNELFTVSIRCEYCKPFANMLISEYITIRAHENKKLNFEASINDECIINIFSEIKNNKIMFNS